MIKFSESEINYIKNTFKRYQNVDIDTIEDEYFKEHYLNLDKSIFEQIEEVLKNIIRINSDENINNKVVSAIDNLDSMWVWDHYGFTKNEVFEKIGSKEYVSIYSKIYNVKEEY